jgi:glycosyltransferase involved in cell wall biosynthesis
MNYDVSIVIPTWNGLSLLKRFLPSVISAANFYAEHSGNKVELVIVDDGSTDATIEWLETASPASGVGSQESGVRSQKADVESQIPGDLGQINAPSNSTRRADRNPRTELPTAYCLLPTFLRVFRNEKNLGFAETCNRGIGAARYPLVFLLNNDVEIEVDSIAPLVGNFVDDMVFAVHCRVFELDSGRQCGTGKVGGFARGFIRVHQSYATMDGERKAKKGPLYSMFAGGGSAMFDRDKF